MDSEAKTALNPAGVRWPLALGRFYMIKTILAASSLAAALLLVGQPAKADWLCGADQCVWVTYNVVNVPAYAVTWAPPDQPQLLLEARYLRPLEIYLPLSRGRLHRALKICGGECIGTANSSRCRTAFSRT